MHQIFFLLGAGASVDAKVPAAHAMGEQAVEGLKGTNPAILHVWKTIGCTEIESLANALQILSGHDEPTGVFHTLVENWKEGLAGYKKEDFLCAFGALRKLIPKLCSFESVNVDYLSFLLNAPPGRRQAIITLNYDLTVEVMCQRREVKVDYGFKEWTVKNFLNQVEFGTAGEGVALFKPHGSVNWKASRKELFHYENVKVDGFESVINPAIIFGGSNKLEIEGPFFGYLLAAQYWLNFASKLVVVGYSFRDRHINWLLTHWIGRCSVNKLIVVNKSFDRDDLETLPPYLKCAVREFASDRLVFIRKNAAELSAGDFQD